MLIDTNSIVKKNELRTNLAEIMERVYNGETIHISDRGEIMAELRLSKKKKEERADKIIADLASIQKMVSESSLTELDTVETLRKDRNRHLPK